MKPFLLITIVGILALPAPAAGQLSLLHEFVHDGSAVDVVAIGTTAYVLKDTGLTVLDITNDLAPVELATVPLTGLLPRGIAVAGNTAFVATNAGGVRIYDVSDPSDPAFLSSYPCTAKRVRHDFGRLYVCAQLQGLIVLDVSNPALPVPIMTWSQPELSRFVDDVESYPFTAFVGTTRTSGDTYVTEVVVLDVTGNPPVILGTYPGAGNLLTLGLHLYSVRDGNRAFGTSALVSIYDYGNPNNLAFLGSTTIPQGVATRLQFALGYLYAFTELGIRTLDVFPPAQAFMVQMLDLHGPTGGGGRGVVVGNRLYQAGGDAGVHVVSGSNPAVLTVAGYWDTPSSARDVVISGNYAYLMGQQFWTIDISDPAHPVPTSRLLLNVLGGEKYGTYLYAAAIPGRVTILDLSDPAVPSLVSQNIGTAVANVRVSDGRLYSVDFSSALRIYDLTNPTLPALLGSVSLPGRPRDLTIADGYAYISGETTGLYIVDVHNPASPQLRANLPGAYPDLDAIGGVLYAARGADGFQTFDLSNPEAPALAGQIPIADCRGLAVHLPLVYLARGTGGVAAAYVASPDSPVLLTGQSSSSAAVDIAVQGGLAIAGLSNGVAFYQVGTATTGVIDAPVASAPAIRAVPNPVVGSTRLRGDIPPGPGLLTVIDVAGRTVRSWAVSEGAPIDVAWDGTANDGRPVGAGVYFVRLDAGGRTSISRVVRLAGR